jgi:hypothetical protein
MASDMQEPPELIGDFIRQWEQGCKVVVGVKPDSHETAPMFALRRLYYATTMLGITSHSKVPLRLATMAGFALSAVSLLIALGYLVYKLAHWEQMSFGMAPILIGFFFFASVQLFFIGLLGEYILQIHTQVQKRPLVMERERINFNP